MTVGVTSHDLANLEACMTVAAGRHLLDKLAKTEKERAEQKKVLLAQQTTKHDEGGKYAQMCFFSTVAMATSTCCAIQMA